MDERTKAREKAAKIRRFLLNEQLSDVRVFGAVPRKVTAAGAAGGTSNTKTGSSTTSGKTGASGGDESSSKTKGSGATSVSSTAGSASPGGTAGAAAAAAAAAAATGRDTAVSMAAVASATAVDVGGFPKMIVADDHVTQLTKETCQCCHLQEFLPHLLDWELCYSTKSNGYIVANPVHAMHLSSQFADDIMGPLSSTLKSSSSSSSSTAKTTSAASSSSSTTTTAGTTRSSQSQKQKQLQKQRSLTSSAAVSHHVGHTAPHLVQQPLWYGEDQQRKSALSTEGVVESWCPLDGKSSVIHDDTSVDKLDRLKTLPYYRPDIIASNKAAAAAAAAMAAKKKQQQSSRNQQANNRSKRSKATATSSTVAAAVVSAKASISTATAATTTSSQQKEIDTTTVTSSESKTNDVTKEDEENDQKAKPEPSNETTSKKPDDKPSASTVLSSDSATVNVKMELEPAPDNNEKPDTKATVEPSSPKDDEEDKSDEMEVDDDDTKKKEDENIVVDGEGDKDSTETEPKPLPTTSKGDTDADTATGDKTEEKVDEEDSDPTSKDGEQEKPAENEKNESTPMELDKVEEAADPVPEKTKSSPPPKPSSEEATMDTEEDPTIDNKDDTKNDDEDEGRDEQKEDTTEQKDEKDPAETESSLEISPADDKDEDESTKKETSALEEHKKDDEANERTEQEANDNEEKPEAVGSSSTSVAVEKTDTDAKIQEKHTDEDEKEDVISPASHHSKDDDSSEKLIGEETVPASSDREKAAYEKEGASKDVEPQNGKATDESEKDESMDASDSKEEANEQSEGVPSDPHKDKSIDDKNETPSTHDASNVPVPVKSETVQSSETSATQPPSKGAVTAITSAPAAPTKASPSTQAPKPPFLAKKSSDVRMIRLHAEEERIRLLRRTVKPKRARAKRTPPPASASKDAPPSKKRKKEADNKAKVASGWHPSKVKMLNDAQEQEWMAASEFVNQTVEGWVNRFRQSQELYWRERKRVQQRYSGSTFNPGFYLDSDKNQLTKRHPQNGRTFFGDELMQCLECSFVGCGPSSICQGTRNETMQHMLLTGHNFAVTCGERSQIFCIRCGDFVYHEVFEQERFRIKMSQQIPWMAWKPNPVVRSVDAFNFLKTQEHGIVWRGLIASYPPLVPKEHLLSAKLTVRRLSLLKGRINERWLLTSPRTLQLAASQCLKKPTEVCSVAAPIGLYNLGNTCYMSAILQCLIFCEPLQRYFLHEAGHSHHSCRVYRESEDAAQARSSKVDKDASAATKTARKTKDTNAKASLSTRCLACEMDRFYISYLGNTIGEDLNQVLADSCRNLIPPGISGIIPPIPKANKASSFQKGSPMDIAGMITSSWKCGGMKHLAGYEQRDAHEFLSAFLAEIGRNIVKYRERVHKSITTIGVDNAFLPKENKEDDDIIKKLFQGTLRSVLLCEKCGVKRLQKEPFMDVSLSLSEEVERMQTGGKGRRDVVLDLQTCLEHFVLPEKLSDLVFCSSCGTRTPTKKQHTFSKLPKVLCLHLKRFDAARNQKIDQFVSFPAHGLNMGGFLPQWREVSRVPQDTSNNDRTPAGASTVGASDGTTPLVMYDLFGTVNHIGSMSSGHYVSNVKVDGSWYHCNDQHVSRSAEGHVLKSSAYMLFYVRR